MTRWCFILLLVCRGWLGLTAERPNFLFILSDDHRWDGLGAAGNPAVHTPTLDRLAREGLHFRQATIHVPQCSPSRATLLTGLPPHLHGIYSNQHQRQETQRREGLLAPTLPGLLQTAGYHTALIGKWHLGKVPPDPWHCGFSEVRTWLPAGGGTYQNAKVARGNSRATQTAPGFITEVFANDAIAFLRGVGAEKPFFLWLSFTAPHAPLQPNPERIQRLYAGKTKSELLPPGFPTTIPSGDWPHYYEAITHLDEQVGRILAALEERKLAANTVVVLLGDNGYLMGNHGWLGKVYPYEESVRIPLLVRAPPMAGPRGAIDAPVSSLDLPPTILALAGIAPPKEWPGRDLTALLKGRPDHGITEAFCEWADDQSPEFGSLSYRVVRTPTHKLIRWQNGQRTDELYDLTHDPGEARNGIADPGLWAVRQDLEGRLAAWMRRTGDPAQKWSAKAVSAAGP